jgi:recombination protein RecA
VPRKKATAAPPPKATAAGLAAEINKVFGEGAVGMASDDDLQVKRWPTGVLPIDYLLDGGVPRGRFIEVYGPYSTLKSYWLYKALGAVQQQGGSVALVDTEHSFDPEWATDLGVNVNDLLISRPVNAEQGIGVLEALTRQKYDLVGFDSIAAAIPKQHQESKPGEDTQPGALARVMSKGLARLTAANKHTAGIYINHTRNKIGQTYGSPETTSGGLAMGYYASYRMSFRRTGKITDKIPVWNGKEMSEQTRVLAHTIQVTMEKSKLSRPHMDALFPFDLTTGSVDDVAWLVTQGLSDGLLTRGSAGHWGIPGVLDKPIHGKDAFMSFVRENEEVVEWLKTEIMPTPVLASRTA